MTTWWLVQAEVFVPNSRPPDFYGAGTACDSRKRVSRASFLRGEHGLVWAGHAVTQLQNVHHRTVPFWSLTELRKKGASISSLFLLAYLYFVIILKEIILALEFFYSSQPVHFGDHWSNLHSSSFVVRHWWLFNMSYTKPWDNGSLEHFIIAFLSRKQVPQLTYGKTKLFFHAK